MRQGNAGKEPEYRRQQTDAAKHRDHTKRHEEQIRVIAAVTTAMDRVAAQQEADRNQRETQENQKRNRESLTIGGIAAGAAIAFTALIVTHCDTRDVLLEAEHSTNQASTLANTAIDTEKRQLRAYVFVDDLGISGVDDIQGPKTWVKIKNGGQTPAYKLRNIAEFALREYPSRDPLPVALYLRHGSDTASFSEIGPGGSHSKERPHRPITPSQIAELILGVRALYFLGEVYYKDAFNCDRWIRYRGVLGGPVADHFPQMIIAAEGNDTSDETAEDCLSKPMPPP